jgi:hypothetical protein
MTEAEIRQILDAAAGEMRARVTAGGWRRSEEMPFVIADEAHSLLDDEALRQRVADLTREGRRP